MKTGINNKTRNSLMVIGFFALFAGSATAAFAGYFNTQPVERCNMAITRTLQAGQQNSEVYMLQQMLARADYLDATPNGYYGNGTRAAVRAFQSDNGLSTTGTVGEATRNAVNERLCDNDPRGDEMSYSYDGYGMTGTTYVDQYDPYARVISPNPTTPVVYATPQEGVNPSVYGSPVATPSYANSYDTSFNNVTGVLAGITPAVNQVDSTKIIYTPTTGYTYGISQRTGSVTITSPQANSIYKEGDTMTLSFSTQFSNASQYVVSLENIANGQSKVVTTTGNGSNLSIPLTKELLDAVCMGSCTPDNQTFRIVVSTPVTDIAGNTSPFRAVISPITIKRPYYSRQAVILTVGKNPVDSGESFRLYVTIPGGDTWNVPDLGTYSLKVHAICPNSVTATIAGTPCGQDFMMPFPQARYQQDVPTIITNNTWYKQNVIYEVMVVNSVGQVIGTSQANVTVNAAPINW